MCCGLVVLQVADIFGSESRHVVTALEALGMYGADYVEDARSAASSIPTSYSS